MGHGAVRTIAGHALSSADRERVAAAARDLRERGEFPSGVADFVGGLLDLVAAGRNVSAVPDDASLTTNQAAALLGVSRPFLIKLLEEGRLPYYKSGRDRRIAFQDVRKYIEQRDFHRDRLAALAASRSDRRKAEIAAAAGLSVEDAERLGL